MLQKQLAVTFCFAALSMADAADRPNIVLVMADDQGWGDMAYNGHPIVKTPNFDKAAATGLRFDRFYAAAPVCSPTRASVMTGRHPNRMGVFKWGYPMRPQETTIAEALKTAGYTTGHFGKWHLGSVRKTSPANPGKNGFDEWLSAPNFYDNDAVLSDKGTAVQTKGESSIVAADAAMKWITKQKDSPFLAVVWFGSPHSPHRAVEQDRKLYDDQPRNMQHFLGEITGMDRAFGKIRDGLEDLGIRDNTILWYCSDNGALPKVGSTGGLRGNKGQVYEGGLLVPAISGMARQDLEASRDEDAVQHLRHLPHAAGRRWRFSSQPGTTGRSQLAAADPWHRRHASPSHGILGLRRQRYQYAIGCLDERTLQGTAGGRRSAAAPLEPDGRRTAESKVLDR